MSDRPAPYGTCTFTSDEAEHTVTLHFGGAWSVAPPIPEPAKSALDSILEGLVAAYPGPSGGDFGSWVLSELARRLHGTYRIVPREKMPPGTVY